MNTMNAEGVGLNNLIEQLDDMYRTSWVGYDRNTIRVDIQRHVFNAELVRSIFGERITVCDVGGGWGAFSVACSILGMKAMLIDDFKDSGFKKKDDPRYSLFNKYDITVIDRDAVAEGVNLEASSVDVFTSFDSMEHWHNSPKRLFHDIMTVLKTDGGVVLEVPNNANLRKRIEAIAGRSEWSSMDDWYESPVFRGHVREPNKRDLQYIARDLGLSDVRIFGRNWLGLYSQNRMVRAITRAIDLPLRSFPSLCSNLYLVGRKRGLLK